MMPQKFAVHEEDFVKEHSVMMPVKLFINSRTGEIKMYATIEVEKRGIENILRELNLNL